MFEAFTWRLTSVGMVCETIEHVWRELSRDPCINTLQYTTDHDHALSDG